MRIVTVCLALLLGAGCGGVVPEEEDDSLNDGADDSGSGDFSPDPGADADSDADADGDAGPDADADGDADEDADADVGPEVEDVESDGEEADGGVDGDADADADVEPDAEPDGSIDGISDAADAGEAEAGPVCPNGTIEPPEECDDGNRVSGDGCEPDCTWSCSDNTDCPSADPCWVGVCSTVETGKLCRYVGTTHSCSDGDDCTFGDQCNGAGTCVPGDCISLCQWWPDEDGDTWGPAGMEPTCAPGSPGDSWVRRSGDCCEGNPEVNPGFTGWATESYASCDMLSVQKWDWNCDGTDETRYPTCFTDCVTSGGDCSGEPGWRRSGTGGTTCEPPACGDTGSWITGCHWFTLICTLDSGVSNRQQCR